MAVKRKRRHDSAHEMTLPPTKRRKLEEQQIPPVLQQVSLVLVHEENQLPLPPVVAASASLSTTSAVVRLRPQQVDQQGPHVVQQAQLVLVHEENQLPPVVAGSAGSTTTSASVKQQATSSTKSSVITTRAKLTSQEKRAEEMTLLPPAKRRKLDPSKLTSGEQRAIKEYTSRSYEQINESLRNDSIDACTKTSIETMIRGLDKLPPFVGTVYRATNLPESILDEMKTLKIFSDKAFLSSSNKNFDKFFKFSASAQCRFTIASRMGKDILAYASKAQKDEAEVLFRPNTQFRVTSVTEETYDVDKCIVHIAMEEIVPSDDDDNNNNEDNNNNDKDKNVETEQTCCSKRFKTSKDD